MKYLNAKLFIDALERAMKFQGKQNRSIDAHSALYISLNEVRDAAQYAMESKPPRLNGRQPKRRKA